MAHNAYWCLSPNFGDALTPWIIEKLSGAPAVFVPAESRIRKFMVSGSVLNWADDAATVWGTGLASMNDHVNPKAEILAVRGPLSHMIAAREGAKCPAVYGDPALVLPRLIPPSPKTHRFGIVPHYLDLQFVVASWQLELLGADLLVIDPLQPVDQVVAQITSCETILSSSLHGLIVAGAYDIPAAWVTFGAVLGGDGMKFTDYFLSVGIEVQECRRLLQREDVAELGNLAGVPTVRPKFLPVDALLAACPFRAKGRP